MTHAPEPFYRDPEFWVAIGFVLFIVVLVRQGVHRAIGKALDGRGQRIAFEMTEAARLRAEAQALLEAAQARYTRAEADAATIIEQSRTAAAALAAKAEADLGATIARRSADAQGRIAVAERAAIGGLRARVASLATAAAGRVIAEDADPALHARLADRAICEVGTRLV